MRSVEQSLLHWLDDGLHFDLVLLAGMVLAVLFTVWRHKRRWRQREEHREERRRRGVAAALEEPYSFARPFDQDAD